MEINKSLNIVLIGPPGVGKGTLAQLVADEVGIPHLSTGEIFRNEINLKTELGKEAKAFIDKGDLVPDELTIKIIINEIVKKQDVRGYLLDGFPRTLKQAEQLQRIVEDKILTIDLVLFLSAEKNLLIERLTGRLVCNTCGRNYHVKNFPPQVEGKCDVCSGEIIKRKDDEPETIAKRFDVYNQQTEELVDYYKRTDLFEAISGELTPGQTLEILFKLLKKRELILC